MLRSELEFDLPEVLIAQSPVEPRDSSRLLILNRSTGETSHMRFREVVDRLRPGDILVANDTRVIPARFFARRESGGRIEGFFLHDSERGWRVLLKPSARLASGESLSVLNRDGTHAEDRLLILEKHDRGEWSVRPAHPLDPLLFLARYGSTPLPPYIRRFNGPDEGDALRYQTVYAASPGAVAAPTAGLHFTRSLIDRLQSAGVKFATVTLHVGLGTFAPLDADDLRDHRMHAERWSAPAAALREIDAARRGGGRIIAIGTTAARVLESLPLRLGVGAPPAFVDQSGDTRIFIYPPYRFRNVDGLITNFHLPRSTLLAMVMAFASVESTRRAYADAIEQRYRFFSYGDAMFIE